MTSARETTDWSASRPPIPLRLGARPLPGRHLDRFPVEERTLTRLLRERADARPERPWVVFDGDQVLTFGDAWDGARRVAFALRRDAAASPRVGLMLRARPELVVALHGTLLAGGTAFLLNPGLSGRALDAHLERARLDVLVADGDSHAALSSAATAGVELVALDAGGIGARWDAWLPADAPTAVPPMPAGRERALVLFTSGTTGRPKGVVCSHAYAFAYGALASDSLRRVPTDVLTTSMPLFHSGGLHLVVHSALHVGCLAHVKRRFSAGSWWRDAAADGATQGLLLGPTAEMILRRVERAPEHRMELVSISAFANREEFARRYGVEVLWQGYGMTEIYAVPMPRELAPDAPEDTLGIPIDRFEFGVVDEADRPLPPGATGELVLRPREPGLWFDGYLDDPEATEIARRGDAFHTGDLASYDERGLLRFRGRRAERIRRRGENVDPVEVESAALGFPGVSEAVAYGVPSPLGEDDVKLDVVATGGDVDLPALHASLASSLPRHACPRYLEQRASLPRNASQRVERARLAAEPVDRPGVFDAEAGGQ